MRSNNYFVAGGSNTICDRTGFKVKVGDTITTWDGYQVIPSADALRNPQDFAPRTLKPAVHKKSRSESFFNTDVILPPEQF